MNEDAPTSIEPGGSNQASRLADALLWTLLFEYDGSTTGETRGSRLRPTDAAQLREVVAACTKDVFAMVNVELAIDTEPERDQIPCPSLLAVFIGFGGRMLRGSLTLVAPFSLLKTTYPFPLKAEPEAGLDVLDWSGELANQLIGRISNRLANRGIELLASTPKVLLAEHLRVSSLPRNCVCELRFRAGDASVGLWFDGLAADDANLFGSAEIPTSSAKEGDVLVF